MRIILDTNVLISGIFFKGLPFTILKKISLGHCRTVVSPEIIDEYHRTLKKLKAISRVLMPNGNSI